MAEREYRNLSTPELVEAALRRDEGKLASNGALVVETVPCTGRIPKDKFLEDSPGIHDDIWWGEVNQPVSSETFDLLLDRARKHVDSYKEAFIFEGFVGADPEHRLAVRVISHYAWHSLFARTLFIRPKPEELENFKPDWTVLNVCDLHVDDYKELGLHSEYAILQSLERKTVLIFGSRYGGEIKKSLFYAMNYDMPAQGVLPMHCSANVAQDDPDNVALFFGLSGTGKTTLSADPNRRLIGDDEHGWTDKGVFNFEGGCYAKCINLSKEGEPQIYNAIRFGSVLENLVIDPKTREPDYDDGSITQNTRATYPLEYIPNVMLPSMGNHPKNVVFLAADAFGVLPPVSRLTPEQAQYYFINGYTAKLAGTETGVTEPQASFSPCFGGPFLPRHPQDYAKMLADRVREHNANVWLLNTGWTGGGYGVGHRFQLKYTRAMVTSILDGTLNKGEFETEEAFGLHIPKAVPGVPSELLKPRDAWADKDAYDKEASRLASLFRKNDAEYNMAEEVRKAGPPVYENC